MIYRTSYKKHRERLLDIKHDQLVQYDQTALHKNIDKKRMLNAKIKKSEIESENNILQHKINSIKEQTYFNHASNQTHKLGRQRYGGSIDDDKVVVTNED